MQKALASFTEETKVIQSGFKAAGLVPFNPNEVDYNVLHKKKRNNQKHDKSEIKKSKDVVEDSKQHLMTFESNLSMNYSKNLKKQNLAAYGRMMMKTKDFFNTGLK